MRTGSSSSTRREAVSRRSGTWTEAGLMRDVRFISELIDTLRAAYNIDPTRIYANGLSIGGGMAFVLSCTLSDRLAAVGVGGDAEFRPASWGTDHAPARMIALSGGADRIVPLHGRAPGDPLHPRGV